jgi:cytochrome b subunit of formate dehydrogenase
MLRTTLFLALAAALAGLAIHYLLAGRTALRPAKKSRPRFVWLEYLAFFTVVGSFLTLAITGFYGVIWPEHAMHGLRLLVHVAVGPVFAVSLAALAVMRADACRMGARASRLPERFSFGQKVCFWVFLLSGLSLIVTTSVSMMRILEPDQQSSVIELHRWSGLVAIMAAVVYGYLAVIHRRVRNTVPARAPVKKTEVAAG